MSLLIFSPKCQHSRELIDFIKARPQLQQLVHYHNINQRGVPPEYRNKISRVPTMLTKNGKILVGAEIKAWLMSLLPSEEVNHMDIGGFSCSMTSLENDDVVNDGVGIFEMDQYGSALMPAMTPELEAKINKSVNEAYNQIKK
jgi:hypothetical protein